MSGRKSDARSVAARLGLGRLAYLAWHAPRAWAVRSLRAGGPWQQWLDHRAQSQMREASRLLPSLPSPGANSPEICFLSGERFWYQTAFCASSLQRAAGVPLRFIIHDDGSFSAELIAEIRLLLPGCTIVGLAETESQLNLQLPTERFPALRSQRRTYIHLRKLTDFHAGRSGWRAVLDSDMLFFRRPTVLMEWFAQPTCPIHMVDVHDAYGYPRSTLLELSGGRLPARVNVGICGLSSDAIDWDQIERWCAELLRRHGTSYYLEQALVALWLSRHEPLRLPTEDYRLMPDERECQRPTAAMHHYVDLSKRGYFRSAWRHVANQASQVRLPVRSSVPNRQLPR